MNARLSDFIGARKLLGLVALGAALSLAACSDVDNAMFGDEEGAPAAASPDQFPPAAAAPAPGMPGAMAAPVGASAGPAPTVAITPITIEPGANTGTAVSATIANLRSQLQTIEIHLATNTARLNELRTQGANSALAYQESKARITTRLQIGTTRGNPELVTEWNSAQASLDSLASNINSLNGLSGSVVSDSSTVHFIIDQIQAAYNVSGAVDEDHRQLAVLEDETNQTIVLVDRLMRMATEDTQRQTAYVANERANLTTLAGAIKNGELYDADLGTAPFGSAGTGVAAMGGTPLVVIKFDRPGVDYQKTLYAALTQALQSRPNAGFSVVAVAPTRGNATAVQLAQTRAKAQAQDVLRSMTDMGVPASRLAVASATDPGVSGTEVRVFVR